MKVRSALLRVAFAVLLVFSQMAAATHAVEHLHSTPHEQLPNEQACQQCLAFLSLGSALPGSSDDLAVNLSIYARPVAEAIEHFIPAGIRHFESRAPPASLS